MRELCLFILLGILFGSSSCTQTKYVISKATLDKTMDSIKGQLLNEGYCLTGVTSSTNNENVVAGVSYSQYSGFGTAMANRFITHDTYKFTDTVGNMMSYSISYLLKQSEDGIPFVEELDLCGCETSNPKDYDKLCGSGDIINRVKEIPNNEPVLIKDAVGTVLVVAGVTLGITSALLLLIMRHH